MSCFLFLVPILIWNIVFYSKLPQAYQKPAWDQIPSALKIFENVFRVGVFLFPGFLLFDFGNSLSLWGLIITGFGMGVYFLSWTIQIMYPQSRWSRSALGFLAPGYTPLIWLGGIALAGQKLIFDIPYYSTVYFLISLGFLIAHLIHGILVFRASR